MDLSPNALRGMAALLSATWPVVPDAGPVTAAQRALAQNAAALITALIEERAEMLDALRESLAALENRNGSCSFAATAAVRRILFKGEPSA